MAAAAAVVDHRRCHAPCGSNSVADICGSNCVQLCGRCMNVEGIIITKIRVVVCGGVVEGIIKIKIRVLV